jgi:hypothetical protein
MSKTEEKHEKYKVIKVLEKVGLFFEEEKLSAEEFIEVHIHLLGIFFLMIESSEGIVFPHGFSRWRKEFLKDVVEISDQRIKKFKEQFKNVEH